MKIDWNDFIAVCFTVRDNILMVLYISNKLKYFNFKSRYGECILKLLTEKGFQPVHDLLL